MKIHVNDAMKHKIIFTLTKKFVNSGESGLGVHIDRDLSLADDLGHCIKDTP